MVGGHALYQNPPSTSKPRTPSFSRLAVILVLRKNVLDLGSKEQINLHVELDRVTASITSNHICLNRLETLEAQAIMNTNGLPVYTSRLPGRVAPVKSIQKFRPGQGGRLAMETWLLIGLGGFSGAGLVSFNPEVVISKLVIQLHTPTPPTVVDKPWKIRFKFMQILHSFQLLGASAFNCVNTATKCSSSGSEELMFIWCDETPSPRLIVLPIVT
ncbi:uncharacterized protein BDR25DRAFT_354724 [Lindgomyces ingoldianus]|uniref:Uncharacterized protein n=1 Tax=Lindgomyces ingoldianus TaxID=673940 RepID=A0ACB6QX74_9PLEO|nr:uncharacterized protein BDR25DRAFT_354724 [Lindgomyces ingoldianus]KAF2471476.1 hypothetical protein BDR25DRAFT_354724 [Lindgomyces ingoldianus]